MSRVSGSETGRQALLEAEGAAAAHAAGRRHARCTCTSRRRVVALLPPAGRRAVVTRRVPAAKIRVQLCYAIRVPKHLQSIPKFGFQFKLKSTFLF